jgi:hypothetical protein
VSNKLMPFLSLAPKHLQRHVEDSICAFALMGKVVNALSLSFCRWLRRNAIGMQNASV